MRGLGPFLRDAWRLALPFYRSEEKWAARGLLAAIVTLNLLLVGINVQLSYWNRAFYDAIQSKDETSFWELLLLWRSNDKGFTPGFCILAGLFILIAIYRTYLSQWLRIRWRGWMTERLMADWMAERAYWRIALKADSARGHGTECTWRLCCCHGSLYRRADSGCNGGARRKKQKPPTSMRWRMPTHRAR